MKKISILAIVFTGLVICSCQNPSKSRNYMDEGEKMMVVYSQYDKAEELFTKAIKYDHGNFEAYYFRGCAKINNNKLMEAIADFEKAIELKPDFADAYFNIGRAYFLLHDDDMMCQYYRLAQKYGRPNLEDYLQKCEQSGH